MKKKKKFSKEMFKEYIAYRKNTMQLFERTSGFITSSYLVIFKAFNIEFSRLKNEDVSRSYEYTILGNLVTKLRVHIKRI